MTSDERCGDMCCDRCGDRCGGIVESHTRTHARTHAHTHTHKHISLGVGFETVEQIFFNCNIFQKSSQKNTADSVSIFCRLRPTTLYSTNTDEYIVVFLMLI